MRGANMSVVGRAVVKRFATCTTSKGAALRSSLLVGFEMTIKDRLVSKPFVAAGAFVRFLSSMDSLMGC